MKTPLLFAVGIMAYFLIGCSESPTGITGDGTCDILVKNLLDKTVIVDVYLTDVDCRIDEPYGVVVLDNYESLYMRNVPMKNDSTLICICMYSGNEKKRGDTVSLASNELYTIICDNGEPYFELADVP